MNENKKEAELLMLKSFARGNKEIIIKLINVFLRNTPSMIDELEKQIVQNDFNNIKQAIHKLASQFTFMNFDEGEKILLQLKNDFESGKSPDELIIYLKQLQTVCDSFYSVLNEEIIRLQ